MPNDFLHYLWPLDLAHSLEVLRKFQIFRILNSISSEFLIPSFKFSIITREVRHFMNCIGCTATRCCFSSATIRRHRNRRQHSLKSRSIVTLVKMQNGTFLSYKNVHMVAYLIFYRLLLLKCFIFGTERYRKRSMHDHLFTPLLHFI